MDKKTVMQKVNQFIGEFERSGAHGSLEIKFTSGAVTAVSSSMWKTPPVEQMPEEKPNAVV